MVCGFGPVSRAKVARIITPMEQDNLANVKTVGQGMLEYKIDFGLGYRVYFARDGETLLILLTAERRSGSSATSTRRSPIGKTTNEASAAYAEGKDEDGRIGALGLRCWARRERRRYQMNPFVWRREHQVAIILGAILGAVILVVIGFLRRELDYRMLTSDLFWSAVPLVGRSSGH